LVNPLDRHLRAVAWTKLAESALARGRWAEALEASRCAQAEEHELQLARFAEGRARFELGDAEGAEGVFAALLTAGPDSLGMALRPHLVLQALGIARLRQGDFSGAAEALSRSLADREDGETSFHLGNAYLGLRRLNAAAHWYRRAQAAGWKDPTLAHRLNLCETVLRELEAPTKAAHG
jgi:tetratricopeptide (TPR) repeat protein